MRPAIGRLIRLQDARTVQQLVDDNLAWHADSSRWALTSNLPVLIDAPAALFASKNPPPVEVV